jgi:hypothetical protein
VATFAAVSEPPGYFKKEVRQSSEMNYEELRRYIRDLQQSGFDVVRLKVQLQEKLAFPLNSFIMAVLAIPFALAAGKRGAVAGIATAVGIGLLYIMVSRLSGVHGKRQPVASGAGGLGSGCNFRIGRRILDSESADIRRELLTSFDSVWTTSELPTNQGNLKRCRYMYSMNGKTAVIGTESRQCRR